MCNLNKLYDKINKDLFIFLLSTLLNMRIKAGTLVDKIIEVPVPPKKVQIIISPNQQSFLQDPALP